MADRGSILPALPCDAPLPLPHLSAPALPLEMSGRGVDEALE